MINKFLCLLQGYKRKKEFIITQMPLSTTKTDFWRLVEEHDVHIIVMMNNESEAKVRLYFFNIWLRLKKCQSGPCMCN